MLQRRTAAAVSGVEVAALDVQRLLGKFASALVGLGLSVILGFDPLPAAGPLQQLWADNRVATLTIVAIIVGIGLVSFVFTRRGDAPFAVKTTLQRLLRWLSESVLEVFVGLAAGLLLGLAAAPSSIPFLALIRTHPPVGIGLGAALLLVLIIAPLVSGWTSEPEDEPGAVRSRNRVWLASVTSLVTSALLLGLIGLVTVRPSWCPTTICPAPQLIVVTNPNGVNDGVMEAYYLAQQGDAFVMTQDPASYSFSNLPRTINAVEIGGSSQPYRAVIGIHSLQRNTRYGLAIDGVDVLLDQGTLVTGPMQVYLAGASLSYNTNVSSFTYNQEYAPSVQTTVAPQLATELEVGGSDDLAVQVMTHDEVSLQFRLQVRYHQIVGDTRSRTLIVPHEFAVSFIEPAHWQPYVFSGGKMMPQSTA
jgi:hypothetical protein